MPTLTPFDEHFVHQIPEPLSVVGIENEHWRESYFFVTHGPNPDTDVIIVAMATYPPRRMVDALVLGRVGGESLMGYHVRAADGDPQSTTVGPVTVEVVEPYRELKVNVAAHNGFEAALRFEARTKPYALRRGRLLDDAGKLLWDQSHMIQSGRYSGYYEHSGTRTEIDGWLGQRDHSWGVREHGRIPMWMWLAIQLPDGMLGVWNWELANGARVFTDGCWAPADGSDPVPVTGFSHDLRWVGGDGQEVTYGQHDPAVEGLAGEVTFTLADQTQVKVKGSGTWCAPYRPLYGGGQHLMAVETDDGRAGTAIYEVTGRHHRSFFPDPLGT